MRTELDNLLSAKQRELRHVVRVLFEEFEQQMALVNQPWKKRGRILKIVLYGSYARDDWVHDPVGGYTSDYDILVVVNDPRLTDLVEYWGSADDRLMRDATINEALSAPVNFIVHGLSDVNDQLARGRPFFADIARQGIALYEAEGFELATPRVLPEQEAKAEAEKHFENSFKSAIGFANNAKYAIDDGDHKLAAFLLHQTTELLYHCVLLDLTLYSPKSHKLNFLRGRAEAVAPEPIAAWPRDDRSSRRCFDLLRQAYVNARYSPQYAISDEQLRWLSRQVSDLQALVKDACERRLGGASAPAEPAP